MNNVLSSIFVAEPIRTWLLPSVWVFHLVQYGVCTRKPDGVTTFYRLSGLMQPQYGQLLYGSALRTGTRRDREALLRPPSENTEGERRRGGPELARAQPREGRTQPKSSYVSISAEGSGKKRHHAEKKTERTPHRCASDVGPGVHLLARVMIPCHPLDLL